MHFIEICGTKYTSAELSDMTSGSLVGLGITSFNSIDLDTRSNKITIGFKSVEDADAVHAIARIKPRFKTRTFKCHDALQFLLELHSVVNTWEYDYE